MHMKAARLQTLPLDQVFIVVSYSGKGERFLEANLYIYIYIFNPPCLRFSFTSALCSQLTPAFLIQKQSVTITWSAGIAALGLRLDPGVRLRAEEAEPPALRQRLLARRNAVTGFKGNIQN